MAELAQVRAALKDFYTGALGAGQYGAAEVARGKALSAFGPLA